MGAISMISIKNFLSTEEQPVSTKEFREFWESCTDEEKEEFKAQVPQQ